MDLKFIKYAKKDHLAIVTINRPEVMNAMHPFCHVEMDQVWDDFVADKMRGSPSLPGRVTRPFPPVTT